MVQERISTFAGFPFCSNFEKLIADIAVIGIPYGVPYDASKPPDSLNAPAAIRRESVQYPDDPVAWDFDLGGTLSVLQESGWWIAVTCLAARSNHWRTRGHQQLRSKRSSLPAQFRWFWAVMIPFRSLCCERMRIKSHFTFCSWMRILTGGSMSMGSGKVIPAPCGVPRKCPGLEG